MTDVAGLPPTRVPTAEHEVLRDDGDALASRLEVAGLLIECVPMLGQIHGFLMGLLGLPAANPALEAIARPRAAITTQRS